MKMRKWMCLLLAVLLIVAMVQLPAEVHAAHENVYVNSGNYRADIIGVARTQVGYRETMENKTKYGAWYGLNYQPWCAMFVTWCARQAGIPKSVIANSAIAEPGPEYFNLDYKDGKEYTPLPGDIFFTKTFSHTGIVFHADGDYFYTLEGNTNNDGSDNGNSVLCLKHKRQDYYFGVYKNSSVKAPAAPVVSTSQETYTIGQTATIQWKKVKNAVSYSVEVFKDGLVHCSENVGNTTSFDLEHLQYGEYLVCVSAHYADGKTGYTLQLFDVEYAPSLYVQYNANGGEIPTQPQYVVVGGEGVNFRAKPSTGASQYCVIPIGTLLTANKLEYGEYTWANVEYAGQTGWCIVSEGYCQRVGYAKIKSGEIVQHPYGERAVTTWGAGSGERKALLDPQTIGLWRENHIFVGWSRSADGSGTIFRPGQTDITAEQINPNFGYYDSYVQMYAIWRKVVGEITVEQLPDKTEYVLGDTLDLTGLRLRVKYVDGTEEVVDTGFRYSNFDSETTGTKTITVHYYDATTTFDVTVNDRMEYEIQDGTAVITHYEQGSGVVIIPGQLEGVPVTAIAPGAFAGCDQLTGITIPGTITTIGEGAFSGCSSLSVVNFSGTKQQWDAITIGKDNEALTSATLVCKYLTMGDFTGDTVVDNSDVIYLLKHTLNPARFPVSTIADLNADGKVDNDDVILLLKHSLNPNRFPLTAAMATATVEEFAQTSTDVSTEELTEESTEEIAEETTEETVEESAEELTEESAEEDPAESDGEPAETSVEELQ